MPTSFAYLYLEASPRSQSSLLQVGSHIGNSTFDGVEIDPIYSWLSRDATPRVSAVLVEPLRDAFQKLVRADGPDPP